MRVRDLAISHNSLFSIKNILFTANWVSKQYSQYDFVNIVEIDKIVLLFFYLIKAKKEEEEIK